MENNCTVGEKLNDECHKTSLSRKVGFTSFSDLSDEDKKLLQWRCEVSLDTDSTVCFHHQRTYLTYYTNRQRYCCDPRNIHTKKISKWLRIVDEDTARMLQIKPGQKMCTDCYKKVRGCVDTETCPGPSTEAYPEEDQLPDSILRVELNTSANALDCSPLKFVSQRDKIRYIKRKVQNIEGAAKHKMSKLMDISSYDLESDVSECAKCKDLDILVDLLVEKCSVSSRKTKIKLLTLVPDSWSKKETVEKFKVSEHLVRQARKLKQEKGILADPECKLGRALSDDVKNKVIRCYESEEFSRVCPGKKDYVSVIVEGEKIQIQKRLLLVNLNEMYQAFKQKHADCSIGFSKFCDLRPKWCIPVGPKGTHTVCVCQYHQNTKLLVAALPNDIDYKTLLLKLVCDSDNRDCMLHVCEHCPGKKLLQEYLSEIFSEYNFDDNDIVHYKTWMHTDRTTLVSQEASVQEFIEILANSLDNLCQHHYIAKSQARYLQEIKYHLDDTSAIVLLDFAENYSFIVQDAVQSYHWDNSQATLHPYAVYLKDPVTHELRCISVCIISDHMKHDTAAVHAFTTVVLNDLKSKFPHLKKIIYYSDGATSQYKNFKNFTNLCHHFVDHNLLAEWHFFATSHGKSPCDGIGGTVKRLVARASLQAPIYNQILNPKQMYDWAVSNITGIQFFMVDKVSVHEHVDKFKLIDRFERSKTIAGIRSHHSFVPITSNKLQMKRVSADEIYTTVVLGNDGEAIWDDYQPGRYVACVYDSQWYIGNVKDRSDEHHDVLVTFMKRSHNNILSWSPVSRKDECWVPFQHIICLVNAPNVQGRTARHYKLHKGDLAKVLALLPNFL